MRLLGMLTLAAALAAGPGAAQFDTSEQVKPILKMIKPQWVSLREYDGQDLLYFTLLEVYRCGIEQIRYRVNDGKPKVWQTAPCDGDGTFSEIGAEIVPYTGFPLGSVKSLRVELTYDDGSSEWAEYDRGDVLQ